MCTVNGDCLCFSSLCDWFQKFAPPSQPIKYNKTEVNRKLVAYVSLRESPFTIILSLVHCNIVPYSDSPL